LCNNFHGRGSGLERSEAWRLWRNLCSEKCANIAKPLLATVFISIVFR
jgi:hypothetical protein